MTFHPVASMEDLAEGFPSKVDVDGTAVCLVRTADEVFAINDVCSHGQVSLAEGEVDGCEIECWLHGSRFDLRTGSPLSLPATDPVPVYPVKIEDGKVLVELQESSA
jgi:3-phenylpropionate/trans-cinnamate dioxygenase ferredoxin subunit